MKLQNQLFDCKRVLEAVKFKYDVGFELSVRKRVLLMVQAMFGDIFDNTTTFPALPS